MEREEPTMIDFTSDDDPPNRYEADMQAIADHYDDPVPIHPGMTMAEDSNGLPGVVLPPPRFGRELSEYMEILRHVLLDATEDMDFSRFASRVQKLGCTFPGAMFLLFSWDSSVQNSRSGALDLRAQAQLLHDTPTWDASQFAYPESLREEAPALLAQYREWFTPDMEVRSAYRMQIVLCATALICAVQDLHHNHERSVAAFRDFLSGHEDPVTTYMVVCEWFISGLGMFFGTPVPRLAASRDDLAPFFKGVETSLDQIISDSAPLRQF